MPTSQAVKDKVRRYYKEYGITEEELSGDEVTLESEDITRPDEKELDVDTGKEFSFMDIYGSRKKEWDECNQSCSEPGHSCRKNWEEWTRGNDHDDYNMLEELPDMKIITREFWCARPAKQVELTPPKHPFLMVVWHYNTGLEPCKTELECKRAVRELQRRHMEDLGLPDIAYNFVVGEDLNIYVGRGWEVKSDPSLPYPQWHHRRLDVAFLATIDPDCAGGPGPDYDVGDRAGEFLEGLGIAQGYVHRDYEMYENREMLQRVSEEPSNKVLASAT